ncbi:MAG: flagellar hook-length control protein FliK [Colwellia sp.]|jgi:flagellar hook-length control protein FliK
MPQVNTIAIDLAPSNDFSSVQSGATSSSKNSNKDFSQVIEQHYQSQKTQQSGTRQETSGNKSKLDTEVLPEKENVQGKPSSLEVQSPKSETGTDADNEVNVEETGKSFSSDKGTNEKTVQLDISQKKSTEKNDVVLIDVNNAPSPANKVEDSTQQLMSLLSASANILNDDVKGDSKGTLIDNKKLSTANVDHKISEKTELDALLKQVLGESNKEKSRSPHDKIGAPDDKIGTPDDKIGTPDDKIGAPDDKIGTPDDKIGTPDDKFGNIKVERPIKGLPEASTERTNPALIANVESKVKPSIEVDESIKSERKLDLSVSIGKNSEDGESPSIKITDAKIQQLNQTNKETQTETVSRTDRVVDKSNNASKQQMSASELEALVADVENTTTDPELEIIKADLIGNQDKVVTLDKSTQNNAKTDNPVTKNIAGSESLSKAQNESVVSKVDTSIDTDNVNSDKVAFAGVSVSGKKQALENTQNQSRVINQATHKVLEPQTSNTGEQFKEQSKEQSLDQQNQKQAQTLTNAEKLVNNEALAKEKPFSEIFDKKLVSTSIENTLNRDFHQVNEATKSAASAEEMITKLTSDQVQSTTQSVSNAKQVTSLQNEALSVYRKDFTNELKDKVMVMMNQKLQQIEIRLDPQELGNVNVKINLQNELAVVSFTVQNQQAKEAFDQNLGRLKEMLAESGVDVGDANVEQESKQNDNETLGDARQQDGEGDVTENELSDLSGTQTLNLVKGSSTGVDYYA